MFHPGPIIQAVSAVAGLLKIARDEFFPNKTINEAEAASRKRIADDVGSLQQQITAYRQITDKLLEQAKADKQMIEKHNDALVQLSGAVEQTVAGVAGLRTLAYWSLGLAGLAALAAIALAIFK